MTGGGIFSPALPPCAMLLKHPRTARQMSVKPQGLPQRGAWQGMFVVLSVLFLRDTLDYPCYEFSRRPQKSQEAEL